MTSAMTLVRLRNFALRRLVSWLMLRSVVSKANRVYNVVDGVETTIARLFCLQFHPSVRPFIYLSIHPCIYWQNVNIVQITNASTQKCSSKWICAACSCRDMSVQLKLEARALGRAHVPPTKLFRRLAVNKTIVKPRAAAAQTYLLVRFSRRNKIPRCSAYDIGENNPVPASGL